MTGMGIGGLGIFMIFSFIFIGMYAMFITVALLGTLLTKPGVDYIKKTFVYLAIGLCSFSLFAFAATLVEDINPFVAYFGIVTYCILFTIAFIRLRNRRKNVGGNKYLSKRVNNVRR
jgi:hypothetical protein